MKYLITGGAGFIGSHIARALLQQGADVRILDNFSSGKRENLRDLMLRSSKVTCATLPAWPKLCAA